MIFDNSKRHKKQVFVFFLENTFSGKQYRGGCGQIDLLSLAFLWLKAIQTLWGNDVKKSLEVRKFKLEEERTELWQHFFYFSI